MKKAFKWLLLVAIVAITSGCSGGNSDVEYRYHYDPNDIKTYKGSIEQQKDIEWLDKWEKEDPESFYGL